MMQKLLVLYPLQPDGAAFQCHYLDKHLPLARELPGVRASRHSFDVQSLSGDEIYSCVFEADFDSAFAMGEAMRSPAGQALAADVATFAQVAPTILTYAI